jgi:hypothetical protein
MSDDVELTWSHRVPTSGTKVIQYRDQYYSVTYTKQGFSETSELGMSFGSKFTS